MVELVESKPSGSSASRSTLSTLGVTLGVMLWVYWPSIRSMSRRWSDDPRYSHGYLVPAFALGWAWFHRDAIRAAIGPPGPWGLGLLAMGLGARIAGAYTYFEWLETSSLVVCLAGLMLLIGGRSLLGATWQILAFLEFMVPLPYKIEIALDWPLQRVATITATYALQTLGLPAIGAGNIIHLGETQIGVVEACSGLSMLVLFVAMATALAMLSKRPAWERLCLVAGSLPIALIANVTRIVATAVVHETLGAKVADLVFHDLAGWLMMPLALFLLWAEAWFLSRLLLDGPGDGRPIDAGRRTPFAKVAASRVG